MSDSSSSLWDPRDVHHQFVSAIAPPESHMEYDMQLEPQRRQYLYNATRRCSINHIPFPGLHRVTLVLPPDRGPRPLSSPAIPDHMTRGWMESTHLAVLVYRAIDVLRLTLPTTSYLQLTLRPSSPLPPSGGVPLVHPAPTYRHLRCPTIPRHLPCPVLLRTAHLPIRNVSAISVRTNLSLALFFCLSCCPECFTPDLYRAVYSGDEDSADPIFSSNEPVLTCRSEGEHTRHGFTPTSTMRSENSRRNAFLESRFPPLIPMPVEHLQEVACSVQLLDGFSMYS
jgi:hypothetical protein